MYFTGMKILNPYNRDEVGEIRFDTLEEIEEKVRAANAVKDQMKALSACEKSAILLAIVNGIRQKYDTFIEIIINESGKPYRYAKGEVDRGIQTFTLAAEECKRLPHELMDLDSTEKGKMLRGEVVYFPKGVVLGISPFNFPLNLVAHKVAPAIASGCPILLKPSERTPLTAVLLEKIIASTALPKGGFQLIHCSKEITMKLVRHPRIDVLSFTGSAKVGWEMKANAGKKQVILELGGNAAAILASDADINNAVDELIIGGFAYSGQVCIHTQRILVHTSLYDKFIAAFLKRVQQIRVGDPLQNETEFSVLIDEANALRMEKWVDEAVQAGAKCLIGGNRVDSFYTPTVLTNVPPHQKVVEEEVFGPVVVVEAFTTLEEAVNSVNESRWGLQATLFTNRMDWSNYAFDKLEVGALIHNRSTTFRVDDMPYGGIKDSGFGREGIRYAMRDFLTPKLFVKSVGYD